MLYGYMRKEYTPEDKSRSASIWMYGNLHSRVAFLPVFLRERINSGACD